MLVAGVAHAQPAFDPVEPDGWPKGRSIADLRALHECAEGELSHTPGAAITCRPAIAVDAPQWGMGFDWTSGATFGDVATSGGAQALGVEADVALLRTVQLGARYELVGVGMAGMPAALSNQFVGMLKYRLFADEVERNGWVLGVGGGYALRGDALGGSSPLLRTTLARELGVYTSRTGALATAIELAYERSPHVSAVLASVRLGFETNIRPPEGLGRAAPHRWGHTTSFDALFGPWLGLGMSVGLRAGEHLSLETSAGFLFDYTQFDQKVHGYENASWSAISGPRYQSSWPDFAPLYVQAQGGGAWVSRASGGELRGIAVGEVGFRALIGCSSAADLGFWLRGNVDRGGDVTAGGMVLRLVVGNGPAAAGGNHRQCDGPNLHLATYVPVIDAPRATGTLTTTTIELTPPNVDLHVGGQVQVAVQVPQPVELDVDLGVAFGPVQARIDPRLLPLAQLRGAGFLRVELIGPPQALASFQAQLSGVLSRDGIRVDGWASTAIDAQVVRAHITVYPPGSRP